MPDHKQLLTGAKWLVIFLIAFDVLLFFGTLASQFFYYSGIFETMLVLIQEFSELLFSVGSIMFDVVLLIIVLVLIKKIK
jgi:hypothetical protein